MPTHPRLALLPGEPAGVGPELCVRIAQEHHAAALIAYGDADSLLAAARALGLPLELLPEDQASRPGALPLRSFPTARPSRFGQPDPANAPAVIAALEAAAREAQAGRIDGLVTGPVHKATIRQAGIDYLGSTELLARIAGVEVVMMLANARLRVALATTHLPLRAVADALTPERLERVLRITDAGLRKQFGIASPRIRVLGLNPHAGEAGTLGREEIEVIQPVLERLRGEGMLLEGPLAADSAFLPGQLHDFDAVLAMYHDQGLPVLKASGFEDAVNLTLGLPWPRVAVDHGTALDLAGRGLADASSLRHALALCIRLAR